MSKSKIRDYKIKTPYGKAYSRPVNSRERKKQAVNDFESLQPGLVASPVFFHTLASIRGGRK